jgi:hypothetical protein
MSYHLSLRHTGQNKGVKVMIEKAGLSCLMVNRQGYLGPASPWRSRSHLSVVGGVQPEVLISVSVIKKRFSSTMGRFFGSLDIRTFPQLELTRAICEWSHRAAWENLVNKALKWADARYQSGKEPLILKLSDDGCDVFWTSGIAHLSRVIIILGLSGVYPKERGLCPPSCRLLHVFEHFQMAMTFHPLSILKPSKGQFQPSDSTWAHSRSSEIVVWWRNNNSAKWWTERHHFSP